MHHEEDLLLVDRFKAGDKRAFDELYARYKRKILNYLYRMMGNRQKAEEITQEAFVKVYMNIDKYKPTGSFSSWVYAIARNLAKNEFRRQSYRKQVSLEAKISATEDLRLEDVLSSDTYDVEEVLKKQDIRDQIAKALRKMPTEYREVIVLCVMQEKPYEEAARILKCTKANVATRLFRARKLFTELISGYGKKKEKEDEVPN